MRDYSLCYMLVICQSLPKANSSLWIRKFPCSSTGSLWYGSCKMHIYLLWPGAILKWFQLDSTDPICHCQYATAVHAVISIISTLWWMEFPGSLNRWYILPIGWLCITYHLLREPETALDVILRILGFFSSSFTGWIYPLKTNKHRHSKTP